MSVSSRSTPLATPSARRNFRRQLLRWYDQNQRDLPWRKDRDPYHIWISEIMLQQTRVSAVIDYYLRFLKRFPSVTALATSSLDSVLAVWSGLGYYRRARALHQAARRIVEEYRGEFPGTAEGLRSLPGVGPYTAAAIASIAFGEPVAVVDGNVERVLQRTTGEVAAKLELWNQAESLLCRKRPGDFNQAMMELGATVCLPRAPRCLLCPVAAQCQTRGELPVSRRETRRKREIRYSLQLRRGSIYLVQRAKDASLMPGMWELPEHVCPNGKHESVITLRHSITTTDYTVCVLRDAPGVEGGQWIRRAALKTLPLTGLARKILRATEVI